MITPQDFHLQDLLVLSVDDFGDLAIHHLDALRELFPLDVDVAEPQEFIIKAEDFDIDKIDIIFLKSFREYMQSGSDPQAKAIIEHFLKCVANVHEASSGGSFDYRLND
jgi:hypothetical protein